MFVFVMQNTRLTDNLQRNQKTNLLTISRLTLLDIVRTLLINFSVVSVWKSYFIPSLSHWIPVFLSYSSWCTSRSGFFHICNTSLLFQLLLILNLHADLIPTAKSPATPPRPQGCPRSPSKIPDHCFAESSG